MRIDAKGQVAQDLGTEAIAQTHMLESDHLPLLRMSGWPGCGRAPLSAGREPAAVDSRYL
jgi:hypothetical protein